MKVFENGKLTFDSKAPKYDGMPEGWTPEHPYSQEYKEHLARGGARYVIDVTNGPLDFSTYRTPPLTPWRPPVEQTDAIERQVDAAAGTAGETYYGAWESVIREALSMSDLSPVQETGAHKPRKQARISEVDPWALEQLARVAGHGSDSEERDRLDYLKGAPWSDYYDALQRHSNKFWQGFDHDDDGHFHLAKVAWNALALLAYFHHEVGTDDRYVS